ncbi:MAG: hypothetical protein IJY09_02170 [Lachnospiraceae bacterium]|nr:hypothetical protein [Lachnospiraceae bacterium]
MKHKRTEAMPGGVERKKSAWHSDGELEKKALLLLLFTLVTIGGILSITGLEYEKGRLWWNVLFSYGMVVVTVALPRKYGIGIGGLYFAVLLLRGWSYRELIADGFWHIVNRGQRLIDNYYQLGLSDFATSYEEAETVTTFLSYFVLILLVIYALSLFAKELRGLATLMLSLVLAFGLVVGVVPGYWLTGALAGCIFLSLLSEQRAKAVWIAAGLYAGLFLLLSGLISKEYYEEHILDREQKEELIEVFQDINTSPKWDGLVAFVEEQKVTPFWESLDLFGGGSGNGTGNGLNGGKFSNKERIAFENETALKVTLPKVDQSVYLKGYVGSTYTAEGWKSHSQETKALYQKLQKKYQQNVQDLFADYLRMTYEVNAIAGEEEYRKETMLSSLLYPIKLAYNPLWRLQMSVDYVTANKKYMYAPYYTDYELIGNTSYQQDLYVAPKQKKKSYSFEFYQVDQLFLLKENTIDDAMYVDVERHQDYGTFAELEEAYREFVYEVYTQVPDGHGQLQAQATRLAEKKHDTTTKVLSVIDYLSDFTYTLNPGKLPENGDFVNYFLFENKKGYCVHFASSAVLLLRSMGVPTRYVEGYLVSANDIRNAVTTGTTTIAGFEYGVYTEKSVDVKMVEVKDYSGHAWIEVYFDELGWLPVEVTFGNWEGANELPDDIYQSMENLPTPTPLPTNTPAPTKAPTPTVVPELVTSPTPIPTMMPSATPTLPIPDKGTPAPTKKPGQTDSENGIGGNGASGSGGATGGIQGSEKEAEEKQSLSEWLDSLTETERAIFRYVSLVGGIILIMLLLLLFFFLRYKLVWHWRSQNNHSRRKQILQYYRGFEQLFAEYKLRLGEGESYQQFAERVMEQCPIVPENFHKILELALQARFSIESPAEEELQLVEREYQAMKQRFYEQCTRWRVLYSKFVKLY